jgi:hypothetical protein
MLLPLGKVMTAISAHGDMELKAQGMKEWVESREALERFSK